MKVRLLTLERQLALSNVSLCRLLVRVRAVTQSNTLDQSDGLVLWTIRRSVLLSEVTADGIVVLGGHLESLQGKLAASSLANVAATLLPCLKELSIVPRVRKDGDTLMVLSGSTEESDSTNVNLLNRVCERAVWLGDRLGEWVEVADNDRNGRDGLRLQILFIRRDRARQDSLD